MKKEKTQKAKKPIFKKWWFWVIVVIILVGACGGGGSKENNKETYTPATETQTEAVTETETEKQTEIHIEATTEAQTETEKQTEAETEAAADDPELDAIDFHISDVRNDVTGNWRISTIAENIQMQDHALAYYKKYFKNDNEIHGIVNFNYKTTTKIMVLSGQLGVSVYEYVDGEEHDAKELYGGMLLSEYFVNMDTGEVEQIQ